MEKSKFNVGLIFKYQNAAGEENYWLCTAVFPRQNAEVAAFGITTELLKDGAKYVELPITIPNGDETKELCFYIEDMDIGYHAEMFNLGEAEPYGLAVNDFMREVFLSRLVRNQEEHIEEGKYPTPNMFVNGGVYELTPSVNGRHEYYIHCGYTDFRTAIFQGFIFDIESEYLSQVHLNAPFLIKFKRFQDYDFIGYLKSDAYRALTEMLNVLPSGFYMDTSELLDNIIQIEPTEEEKDLTIKDYEMMVEMNKKLNDTNE